MRTPRPKVGALFVVMTASFFLQYPCSTFAQTPTASPAEKNDNEETVILSPFVVASDKDVGYVAANTLAGTRMNTALASAARGSLLPVHLCCEYAIQPLGIGERQPRLSREFDTDNPTVRRQRQTAYRVLVASTIAQLQNDQADRWDSGKVASDEAVRSMPARNWRDVNVRPRAFWTVTDGDHT